MQLSGAIIEPIRDNVPNCDFLRVHCKDSRPSEKVRGESGESRVEESSVMAWCYKLQHAETVSLGTVPCTRM